MLDNVTTLKLLDAYARIPTISSEINPEMVEQVRSFWRDLGVEFELLWPEEPAKGDIHNPALYTEVKADVADAPTLLLYGHWDVQPTGDLSKWQWREQPCPPFEPTYFVDEKYVGSDPQEVLAKVGTENLGKLMMVARGTADNKGQHLANILGVLKAKAAGQLQWNVRIILDGEEEVGSPNLAAIVQTHREKLLANFMVGSDGPKSDNRPTLLLGVRGLLAVILRCENGTNRMLHSGNYGNVVQNPVLPLSRLLQEMQEATREMGQASANFRQEVDRYFERQSPDRPRYEPFLTPTFNVNSLLTEGATTGQKRTIIPSWAEASIDVRLTPGMVPLEVYRRLEELTAAANEKEQGVQFSIEMQSACAASYTSPAREGYQWLTGLTHRFWGDSVLTIPLLGGTLPNDVFTDGLGMASYWLPAANSNNRQHDTNEHFVLEHFFRQQEFYAMLASSPYQG
ncbi:MAG TPA: M20/M25/M40 family metallo-hydrolase [Chloroflexia bacterium]|nr:M20/M25/M40 family metallo-hydrolase [Chloroflexia bacterium]